MRGWTRWPLLAGVGVVGLIGAALLILARSTGMPVLPAATPVPVGASPLATEVSTAPTHAGDTAALPHPTAPEARSRPRVAKAPQADSTRTSPVVEAPPLRPVSPEPAPPTEPPPLDIDAWVDALPAGALAFNAPERMEIEQSVRVRLLVQPGEDPASLQAAHAAGAGPREQGPVQGGSAQVSPEIEARLVSSTLRVVALDPERQSVSAREPTEWRWDVTAEEGGAQSLALTVFAIPPDGASVRRIETFERALEVEVPLGRRVAGFIGDNLEWIWTVLIAPVGGFLYARWRSRRAPPAGE